MRGDDDLLALASVLVLVYHQSTVLLYRVCMQCREVDMGDDDDLRALIEPY